MSALTDTVIDAAHAAHANDATAEAKQEAAAKAKASITADVTARATLNLTLTNAALTSAASIALDATAQLALGNLATLAASIQASITAGTDPVTALATAVTTSLGLTAEELTDALTTTLAQFEVNGGGSAEAAIPMLEGLVKLGVRATSDGLEWGAGVELPFLNNATFAGSVTGDLAGARRVEAAAGFAARLQGGAA